METQVISATSYQTPLAGEMMHYLELYHGMMKRPWVDAERHDHHPCPLMEEDFLGFVKVEHLVNL
jgi:hypothetical protein